MSVIDGPATWAMWAMWGTILSCAGLVLGVGTLVYAIVLAALGFRDRRRDNLRSADDRLRGASVAAAMGGGLLAAVGLLNGIPTILRAALSIDSETAGAINASITAVSLAVIAVCSVLIVRRNRT
ncbi:hypothetical protein [Curtobacterium sp. L1-20]|uniref:hypothetical protein n=1 Tax=Curtobacterium sp. L1-20 TaxID=3138181 RepID=UPI003B51CBB4